MNNELDLNLIKAQLKNLAFEVIEKANLKAGQTVVIGCSSSEISGKYMGTDSNGDLGEIVFLTLSEIFNSEKIFVAAQCCEHLNRAIIIEKQASLNYEEVNVVPVLKAGGSFATAAYKFMKEPVAVEEIKADAGIDIGGVLIGMHLKKVAVPLNLQNKIVGNAIVLAARTRAKFIGGERANYNSDLM